MDLTVQLQFAPHQPCTRLTALNGGRMEADPREPIDVENVASQVVARKLGARNRGRGQLPPPYEHIVVDIWGQTRAEWFARRAASVTSR